MVRTDARTQQSGSSQLPAFFMLFKRSQCAAVKIPAMGKEVGQSKLTNNENNVNIDLGMIV